MPSGTEHSGVSSGRKVSGSRPLPRDTARGRAKQLRDVVRAMAAPVQLQPVSKTVDEQRLDYYTAIGAKTNAARAHSKLSRDLESELAAVEQSIRSYEGRPPVPARLLRKRARLDAQLEELESETVAPEPRFTEAVLPEAVLPAEEVVGEGEGEEEGEEEGEDEEGD